jgi:DNA-binding CsgD family transcriptional regulator/tetratricopeptide (TPR) repeat protein
VALVGAWVAAGEDAAAPIVVYGEPGIGKTRMLAELAQLVQTRGAEVLWGTCHEGGDTHPYAVWAEAIGGYVERFGRDALGAALGGEVRWLAPLLPDVPGLDSGRVSAPAGAARVRLAEVLVRIMDGFARPPLVVLDDMQWAYPESLELFGHVSRLANNALVVVCCRGTALDLGHPLAQRLAEVQRRRSCTYLSLGSLSREEAGELLEHAAGRPLEAGLVDSVYEESGGNPFFLRELGRHLHRSRGRSRMEGGGGALPESIRAAVGLRLAGLSAETRDMLQLASVFTGGFGFAELQALSELDEGALLDCLEQALAEELVFPLEGERYDFAHALVRQTLYDRLSPSRRARLHRRLAEALERLYGNDLTRVAGELVRQYHASATLPGAERGAMFALTAAQVARAAGAPGDGVMVLHLGLELVSGADKKTRARVLGELSRAEVEAGRFEDATRSLEAAISVLERAGEPGESIAELVYEVGVVFVFAVALHSLHMIEPLIARALAAVEHTRSLAWARLKLLHRYARPEVFGPIRVLRAVRFDPDAVRIARSAGTEADYALTINSWDPALGGELEQLIARIDGWQDPVARLRALVNLVYVIVLTPGSSPAVDRLCAEFGALADDVGLVPHRALARVFHAALLGGRGELETAAKEIEQARALFEPQGAPGAIPAVLTFVDALIAQHVAPDWLRLATSMWELATNPREGGLYSLRCAAFAAQAFAHAGEVDRAHEVLGYILPTLESADPLEPMVSNAIDLAGAAAWQLRAADLAERLLPQALALVAVGGFDGYMTSTELTVARLSTVLGRVDRALDHFSRARATVSRHDQRVLRAIVDYDEALARRALRQPGAGRLLAEATVRFDQLGMHEWSRRAALVDVTDPELPDRLTAREAEILRLVALGRTNKEIAAELIISVHTVERHIQNAYRKIDARNRADASTYVARVGL